MDTSSDAEGAAGAPSRQDPEEDSEIENVSGEGAPATVARNRKVQFRFDSVVDELLAKVLAHNPYEADFGAVGPTWERVADALRVGVDGRRCRERIKLLVKGRKQRVAELESASGIEETVSDLDAMLDEIITIQESSTAGQAERKQAEKEVDERADKIAEGVWQKVVEGMKPCEKRKAPSEDTTLVAFLEARQATEAARQTAETEAKRLKLALEARRLELEERRIQLAERRAALDTQERLAIIKLLISMSAKSTEPEN
jgi:hypothetical protein